MSRDVHKLYPHDKILAKTILPFIPKFIKPNHLTLLRFITTPIVFWLVISENFVWAVPVFLLVAFTDALDGSIARVRKQITKWGTFYDPLADKILVGGTVVLIVFQYINIWFGLLIVGVEVMIGIGAFIWRRNGNMKSANIWGKVKMCLQVAGLMFLLIALASGADLFINFSVATFSLAIVFAVISLFTYGI